MVAVKVRSKLPDIGGWEDVKIASGTSEEFVSLFEKK